MNLVVTVLEITAPVFLLASVGFAWVRMGFEYRLEFVTRMAMTLAVPCLVFVSLMQAEVDPTSLTTMSLAALALYTFLAALFWLLVRLAGLERRTYLAPLIFGNTGNLGLPLALFAFGPEGMSYAIVVFAITIVGSFTFGVWLVAGGGSPVRALKEPMVAATLLGALFLSQGWQTPQFLTDALALVGQMAIPLMLITLGVAVARLRPGRLHGAAGLSLLRALLCALAAWGFAAAFGLDPVARSVLILLAAMPVAVASYLLAEKYGADVDAVSGLVVVSTALSVLYLPLLLALLL